MVIHKKAIFYLFITDEYTITKLFEYFNNWERGLIYGQKQCKNPLCFDAWGDK